MPPWLMGALSTYVFGLEMLCVPLGAPIPQPQFFVALGFAWLWPLHLPLPFELGSQGWVHPALQSPVGNSLLSQVLCKLVHMGTHVAHVYPCGTPWPPHGNPMWAHVCPWPPHVCPHAPMGPHVTPMCHTIGANLVAHGHTMGNHVAPMWPPTGQHVAPGAHREHPEGVRKVF